MPLPMTRPWKHPKTGLYWLRKRVPDELQELVGKREEKFSLRTRNPDEAKRLHAQALLDLERRWEKLRKGVRPLLSKEVQQAANDFRAFYISYFGSGDRSGADTLGSSWKCKAFDEAEPGVWISTETNTVRKREIGASIADAYAKAEGLVFSEEVQGQLVAAIIAVANNVASALAFGGAQNPFQSNPFGLPSAGKLPQSSVSAHPLTMRREEDVPPPRVSARMRTRQVRSPTLSVIKRR